MVKTKLVGALIEDGATLLRELDRRGFPVESMFWIHLPERGYWRLIIASPLVSSQGTAPGYSRLLEILSDVELAGVTLEDISLMDPNSREFRSLLSSGTSYGRLASGAAWLEFEDAVVYRWNGAAITGELSCGVSLDDLNQIWRSERRTLNLPALLIDQRDRTVTLRFHPRHGPLGGLNNVTSNFESALRQARPDCQITWR